MGRKATPIFTAILVTLILAGTGCGPSAGDPVEATRDADYSAGEQAYLRADYTNAILSFGRYIDKTSKKDPLSRRAGLFVGRSYLATGQFDLAAEYFIIATKARDRYVSSRALEGLGDVARAVGNASNALEKYRSALDDGGDAADKGTLYFKIALARRMSGDWTGAAAYFRKAAAFEDSPYAERAAREAGYADTCFRIQIGSFYSYPAAKVRLDVAMERGIKGVVREVVSNGATVYRVLAGEYKDFAAASAAFRELKLRYADAFIVP